MITPTLTDSFDTVGCRPVIINVDDLGLSDAINDAVITLGQRGRVSASSYMAGGQIDQDQIDALARLGIDIGLHLDFTGIYPSPVKSGLKSLLVSSYLRKLDPAVITDIIQRQLDEFEDTFNHPPVFIDGHQHVHQFPVLRQCLAAVIMQRYYNNCADEHRASGTITPPPVCARVTTPLVNDVKSWIIYLLGGRAWQQLCDHQHIPTNGKFGGVYDFNTSEQTLAALWEKWLSHAPLLPLDHPAPPPSPLIMCHPAKPNRDWQDEIKAAREVEYQWLMSDGFQALCDQYYIELVGWRGP